MFYLKYVLLEMTQEGQREVNNIGADGQAWISREPWKAWISSLREVRIQVLPMDETQKSSSDDGMEEWKDQNEHAVLWITDDAKRAEEYARQGMPVLGVLQEKDLATQIFDGVPFLVSNLTEVEPEYLEKVYRRQVGLPWEIARTKRCVIRESVAEDARAFYEIYKDPTVTEFMEDLPKDPEAFAAWLEDYTKHVYSLLEYGIWTICLKQEVIGRAGLTVREGYDAPELGFVIGGPWRGQGFALEVCEAVLEYAKELEIPEVIAFAEAGNAASFGLLHKLGFQEMREVLLDGRICYMFRKAL